MNKKRCFEKIIVSALVLGLVVSLGLGLLVSSVNAADDSSMFWLNLAQNAWNYFQPGIGVDSGTGLPQGCKDIPNFTDWDLGLYIQAVIDAEKLGIVSSSGEWGADDRLDRVLTFLENRPLMADGLPYLAYSSRTGKNSTSIEQVATDAGNLFVALKNLEAAKPPLKERVEYIVYDRTNYERRRISVDVLLGEVQSGKRAPDIYDYYVTCGFASYWAERFTAKADALLDLIVSAPPVNYRGVVLPSAKITSEPLLLSIFNFKQPDMRVVDLSRQTYLAQEARYNATGKFTAFSEGGTDSGLFVWEWVVMPGGRMWVLQTGDCNDVNTDLVGVTPIVYFKAVTGFLAIYNTPYAQNMVNYVLKLTPATSSGYKTGIDENERRIETSPDIGNGLIVTAARYAVDNDVSVPITYPAPSPLPSPNVSSFSQATVSPTPTLTPTPTMTPVITATPRVQQSPAASPPSLPEFNLGVLPVFTVRSNVFYLVSTSAIVGLLVLILGCRKERKF